ncbi:MAG: rhamnulokinase [Clostridiales bacterium]|nr:rhamnulokinase [Clostridiales bacterium]
MSKELKMLAIDLGASSGRGIVGKFDGNKISLEENHRFTNDPVNIGGALFWDTLKLFTEIKKAISNCVLSENKDIKSISIDTWGVDFGFLDEDGMLIGNPYNYRDPRLTQALMEEVFSVVPKEELYKVTGTQFLNFNSIYQLYSFKKSPYVLQNAKDVLFIPDLLKYFLTGVKQTEYTIASTSQLIDAKTRSWAWDVIDKLGFDRKIFGQIVNPGESAGKLLPHVIEEVGSTDAQVIACASHDTASAVVAVPAKTDDFVYISSGTWSLMGKEIPEPITNDLSYGYNMTNEGGTEGKIRFLKNIMGLWIEQESRRQWAREGEKISFDELSNMAMASKPLACFINPSDLVFQTPGNMPERIVEYCRKTGQYVPQTKGEIVRCIFDSLAMCYRMTCEGIDEITGSKAPFINIVGGGTKEVPLCRLTSDACKRPVVTGPVEATALGNIAIQAIAAGEIKDVKQAREVIANSFELSYFEPHDADMWDDGYERFKKIING